MTQRIAAYRRRRGWAAWWTGTMAPGFGWEDGRPTLADLMDTAPPERAGQSDMQMLHALRSLKVRLRGRLN